MMAMVVFVGFTLPALPEARGQLLVGVALLSAFWLVEWRGILGSFEDRVPRHPIIVASRIVWLFGLALSVVDASWTHWTPWQGVGVRCIGVGIFLAGVGLRLASMRALRESFSYDLKVAAGQDLVTRGPYAIVRHPAYTGLVMWSLSFALWNPSAAGFVVLLAATVPQTVYRIRVEERLMAAHFGRAWQSYAARTSRLVPGLW